MAIVRNNLVMQGLSGKLGKDLVCRQRFGKTIVTKYPRHKNTYTQAQLAAKDKFRKGMIYAKSVLASAVLRPLYEARVIMDVNAMNLALKDYLRAPVIEHIKTENYNGAPGSIVEVWATDDFQVTSVIIEIRTNEGALVEEGNAILNEQKIWTYKAIGINDVVPGTIISATAFDLPGNLTTQQSIIP